MPKGRAWEECENATDELIRLQIVNAESYPNHSLWILYRILPNRGAGRDCKVNADRIGQKLKFWGFQRWFRIENRSITKEIKAILLPLANIAPPP